MADPADLLGPWRGVLNQLRGAAAPLTGASEDALRQLLAPVNVMLELLEQSAAAMRTQAQAFNAAATSFKQAADLLELQAELLEGAGAGPGDPPPPPRPPGAPGSRCAPPRGRCAQRGARCAVAPRAPASADYLLRLRVVVRARVPVLRV